MADISITGTNVVPQSNADIRHGTAGATIAAGEMVYKAAATGLYNLADADSATQEVQETGGMALNGAAVNQPVAVQVSGDVALGAVLTAGSRYYLSSTPGKIQPEADLSTGEEVNLIGLAKSTTVLAIEITRPGVTL